MYLLSHFDSEHHDDWSPPMIEGNMAAVDIPLGIPAVTTVNPMTGSFETDDPIEFQGVCLGSHVGCCACVRQNGHKQRYQ